MVVAVENVVVDGCSMVRAVDKSKQVVVGEDVAVATGSTGTVIVDSKVAGSKNAQPDLGECSTAKVHVPVVVVHSLLFVWRSLSKTAKRQLCGQSPQWHLLLISATHRCAAPIG